MRCIANHHRLSPLCPQVSACWLGDQVVAAGNVPPVTLLAVASLQPHLRVRTMRAGICPK